MLPQATKDAAKKWGVDIDALIAAANDPAEKAFAFEIKPETVKANFATHSFLDEAELNGLKGRLKTEVLAQAEELGIKAIKEKAGLTFEGKDPTKFLEALTTHLKLPVDAKLTEKDKDIKTLQDSIADYKGKYEGLEKQVKDRSELDNFSKLLPANKTKILRDAEIRSRYADDGYTIGEYDDSGTKKPALYRNGEVQKDKELKLIEPKTHIATWMKEQNLIEAEAVAPPPKRSFDTKRASASGGTGKFDHASTYEAILEANGGKWDSKAQAQYTEAMVSAGTA